MKVICGELCGFCLGVKYAVQKAMEALDIAEEKLYCLGEIVHNERVIKTLEDKGMITAQSLDEVPDNSKVIFRAHGEAKEIYDKARCKNIEVIDLTCGKVRAIHKKIEKVKDKSYILLIGKKFHPETIGSISYAGGNGSVIESMGDIKDAYINFKKSNLGSVCVYAQTTFSSSEFDEIVLELKSVFKNVNISVDKSICDVTEKRQIETLELSKKVDIMIIIGGKNSSNTKELFEKAKENCSRSILIQTVDDLKNISFSNNDIVGVMAGASTPDESIKEVVDFIMGSSK